MFFLEYLWSLILGLLKGAATTNAIFYLFFFRYLRTIVHLVTGVFLYRVAPEKTKSRYTNRNVAVVIPTVAPNTDAFLRCCESILANGPRVLIIATVGHMLERDVRQILKARDFDTRFPETTFGVVRTEEANKRKQVIRASELIDVREAPVTICVDDHVYWGPSFLKALLPAFDDPKVGLVGTNKKVIRDTTGGLWGSFTNFIACLYLERHNFQIRSEPFLDGGVFVVSGRTSAMRTKILHSTDFRRGYVNETYFFGLLGPLNPDDDNYSTRWALRNGWKIRIQCSEDCKIVTPLGEPHKFYGQVLR